MRRGSTTCMLAMLAVSAATAAASSPASPIEGPPRAIAAQADASVPAAAPRPPAEPLFRPAERAVSTWRTQAIDSLDLSDHQAALLGGDGAAPPVARCVKLNNYWCIKKAGWNGEIAADAEGHVAFASAVEGAAVAAILLKRYYLDFHRRTAQAIISRWAPVQCGSLSAGSTRFAHRVVATTLAPKGLAKTLRARWLASHSRGFVIPRPGHPGQPRRSVIADRVADPSPPPTIAVGLGEASRSTKAMTLDALLASSPNAPPSRSMIGLRRGGSLSGILIGSPSLNSLGGATGCGSDGGRIAAYAAKAADGLETGPDGDLALFTSDGVPTPNLARMMANMARVEIGPAGAKPALIAAGIASAFQPGRNPETR